MERCEDDGGKRDQSNARASYTPKLEHATRDDVLVTCLRLNPALASRDLGS